MTTTDKDTIKKWINKHRGKPEIIDDPSANGDEVGIRIEFKKEQDKFLKKEEIHEATWEQFFEIFESQQLAFEYDLDVSSSDPSLSFRFIKRAALEENYA